MLHRSSVVHPSPASRWGVQGAASGPRFVCKDVGSFAVAARRVGNDFCDRGFAVVFLRHLMQTGGRTHMEWNLMEVSRLRSCRLTVRHPTARLPARSHPPGAPEDDVARDGGHRPQPRRLGVEVCIVRRPWRGRHHEDRVRRRDGGTPLTPGSSQQDHVDHNTCVLTTRTLQGAVLELAVVSSDSKPHVVVPALENAVLSDDRVGVPWVVVDNVFRSLRGVPLDTCHLPMKYEAVASHDGSAGSRMLRRLISKREFYFLFFE